MRVVSLVKLKRCNLSTDHMPICPLAFHMGPSSAPLGTDTLEFLQNLRKYKHMKLNLTLQKAIFTKLFYLRRDLNKTMGSSILFDLSIKHYIKLQYCYFKNAFL